ncbi:MAG: glycosyltransferase family A protein, partial [Chloroflexota bacterium]
MDQRATIAVIMPVYNKRPYIERALASITAQSRAPDEVIVVDDASTDGSMDAVRSFDHPSLRVLRRSQPGQYAAR